MQMCYFDIQMTTFSCLFTSVYIPWASYANFLHSVPQIGETEKGGRKRAGVRERERITKKRGKYNELGREKQSIL